MALCTAEDSSAMEALDNPGVDPRLTSKSLAASRMLRVLVEVFQSFPINAGNADTKRP